MSNTIAHLVVAKKIYMKNPNLVGCPDAYYLGSIAPDTISSKPDCVRNDKKRVHLRENISDADWLKEEQMSIFEGRLHEFVKELIQNTSVKGEQRDFTIGYLVHLLTDRWNHKTLRQTMLKEAEKIGVKESDKDFFYMMTNDLEALDEYLLNQDNGIRDLFHRLMDRPVELGLTGYIEKDYIEKSMNWWKTQYLPSIKTRKLTYISEPDIDAFVCIAVKEIEKELKRYSIC